MDPILTKLLEYGAIGIFAAYLMWRNNILYKHLQTVEKEKDKIQDDRVIDVKDQVETMTKMGEYMRDVATKLDLLRDAVNRKE